VYAFLRGKFSNACVAEQTSASRDAQCALCPIADLLPVGYRCAFSCSQVGKKGDLLGTYSHTGSRTLDYLRLYASNLRIEAVYPTLCPISLHVLRLDLFTHALFPANSQTSCSCDMHCCKTDSPKFLCALILELPR
jgi:hypothetical protein